MCTHAHTALAITFTLISIESIHLEIQITDDWARACVLGFIVLQLIGNVLPIVLHTVTVVRRVTRLAYLRFQRRNQLAPQFGIVDVPFGELHWRAAVEAYSRFGKGRHKAGLNFGDCITYATARLADQPLLFVGEDFSQTDLRGL